MKARTLFPSLDPQFQVPIVVKTPQANFFSNVHSFVSVRHADRPPVDVKILETETMGNINEGNCSDLVK